MEKLKFEELSLSKDMQKAIADMGFVEASPIQAEAIPVVLEGHDMIGQAQTGTGKTAAFGIPLIEMIDIGSKNVEALVMCPTRELAVQVANELKKLAKYKRGLHVLAIYGGDPIQRQIADLRKGVQIIVGTPGRVIDHLERKTFNFRSTKMVVLDEADEMLNMGFRDDIESILKMMPEKRQTVLFSATMPRQILELTKRYQSNPKMVKVTKNELTVSSVEQIFFEVSGSRKTELIADLIELHSLKLMLIFCNTKRKVDSVVEDFQALGFKAEAIHGDLRQNQRNMVLTKFRSGKINILVATDVAARGIDVSNVDAVFNYDLPHDTEYYIHRIGRTGRAGKSGKAFSFATGRGDLRTIKDIQSHTKVNIIKGTLPSPKEKAEKGKEKLFEKITEVIEKGHLTSFETIADDLCDKGMTMKQLASALLKLNAEASGLTKRPSESRSSSSESSSSFGERSTEKFGERKSERPRDKDGKRDRTGFKKNKDMIRLFLSIGRLDKVSPRDIAESLATMAHVDGRRIGDIDVYDKFSFAEVPEAFLEKIISNVNKSTIKGKKVNIEVAKD